MNVTTRYATGSSIQDILLNRLRSNGFPSATDTSMAVDLEPTRYGQYGQIHGIPGLFVADNSVVRLSGPANPTLTTVALAIRTADYIVSKT